MWCKAAATIDNIHFYCDWDAALSSEGRAGPPVLKYGKPRNPKIDF